MEQGSNFITRLHSGALDIIPWPVIESKEFYKLFPVLRRKLERQPTTHDQARVFLMVRCADSSYIGLIFLYLDDENAHGETQGVSADSRV